MLKEMKSKLKSHWKKGFTQRESHNIGPFQKEYYKELADTANIIPIPQIYVNILYDGIDTIKAKPLKYRNYKYVVISEVLGFDKVKEE